MSTKTIVILVLSVALFGAVGLYFLQTGSTGSSTASTKEFTLKVVGKKLVEGPTVLNVNEGDTVTIKITNDELEELHLHGYDRSVDLTPNHEESLTFVADVSGRFPYELEKSKTELGALEVQP